MSAMRYGCIRMDFLERFKLNVRKADTPFYRNIKQFAKWLMSGASVPMPRILLPLLRMLYEFHFFVIIAFHRMAVLFYRQPLFRSRCASVGKNLTMWGPMPFVTGHVEIHLGDNVGIGSPISIISGHFLERPRLIIKDRAGVGQDATIAVNKEVVIEEDVIISPHCRISDSDGHAREADLRAQGEAMGLNEIRPVRICRHAWIGTGSQIMKGVTIGEGAIIGANSVVISDIPPYCMAMGNPAEVYFKNVGKPKSKSAAASP